MKTLLKVLAVSLLLLAAPSVAEDVFTIDSQMTTGVNKAKPVDDITSADVSTSKTFLFSSVQNCRGCTVEHVWSLDGTHIYTYKTQIRYDRTSWWTNRPGHGTGQWTADIVVNGQHVETVTLDYGFVEAPQQQIIQKRTVDRAIADCHEKLHEFEELLSDIPDDPYYRFMVRKWSERCGDEDHSH